LHERFISSASSYVVHYDRPLKYYNIQRAKFGHRYGEPNVVCAIDGTFIEIKQPREFGERYYSGYKQAYGLNVLSVVDYNASFLYMHIGYPASVHDMAIFRSSQFYSDIENGCTIIGPDYRIIGDSAFAASPFLVRSTDAIGHGSARAVIENAFGQLKMKYRYLNTTIETDIKAVPYFIKTCAILFNLNKSFQ
jgi:hypothetical protein